MLHPSPNLHESMSSPSTSSHGDSTLQKRVLTYDGEKQNGKGKNQETDRDAPVSSVFRRNHSIQQNGQELRRNEADGDPLEHMIALGTNKIDFFNPDAILRGRCPRSSLWLRGTRSRVLGIRSRGGNDSSTVRRNAPAQILRAILHGGLLQYPLECVTAPCRFFTQNVAFDDGRKRNSW